MLVRRHNRREAALHERLELIWQDMPDGPDIALESVPLAKRTGNRKSSAIAELGKVHDNQIEPVKQRNDQIYGDVWCHECPDGTLDGEPASETRHDVKQTRQDVKRYDRLRANRGTVRIGIGPLIRDHLSLTIDERHRRPP